MADQNRRDFLRLAAASAGSLTALSLFPESIQKALAIPAATRTGTIKDVQHIVILMQENRSFDHYFGTLRGVRGFGDRYPVPLASGKPVWYQSDGTREMLPFHFDIENTNALRTPVTPHAFGDAQAAWNQGKFGFWPKFKTPLSMGYYKRADIPFQFALAEAFTICDAYHCSVTTGTDPNRITFWSGSNFNPELRARGTNCTDADAEPNNLRCMVSGKMPSPGYTYNGSAFKWLTIPDVLERAGISWRIYQDPNDNWTGLMHGGLAFESFRGAKPESALYKNGMTNWSLAQLAADVKSGNLPQVSWVLPPMVWSEHPKPSSSVQGAEFTAQVLNTLTADPVVWAKTAFIQVFDENDGLFDHVPPPAVPSYNLDGTSAGKATLDLAGLYFSDAERKYLNKEDTASGTVRPWGLGPRVPMYVVSPWSRGGWVNSQVFDHTSVGQFIEKRFDVHIPSISPWHRAVCGDLTSAFDFKAPNEQMFPELPRLGDSTVLLAANDRRPVPNPPQTPEMPQQETGSRKSRALPYELNVFSRLGSDGQLSLAFVNSGAQGAVFHVYDKLHLDRLPRRYTVETGKRLSDSWQVGSASLGGYDLWVYGPNGFVRQFRGSVARKDEPQVEIKTRYDAAKKTIAITAQNRSTVDCQLRVKDNAYGHELQTFSLLANKKLTQTYSVAESGGWYDFAVATVGFERRLAGRVEIGDTISDPAMGT